MASENSVRSYTRTDDIGLALVESPANNSAPNLFAGFSTLLLRYGVGRQSGSLISSII
jgi:hypothetical protein